MKPSRRFLYLAFACSGAAALIYETTWTRLLGLFMGHTAAAASSVLAAFMGGLAIGAALAGRIAPGVAPASALRGYAALEILIGLLAIAVPFEIAALQPLLSVTYADGNGGALFGALRLAIALLAVTLPAMAMGATLPLVVRWAVGSARHATRDTARLYASNAFGATAGAIASGFLLLPALGMRSTTLIGVALNVVSAAIALWLVRAADVPVPEPAHETAPRRAAKKKAPPRDRVTAPHGPTFVAAALGISGAASLILQVVWMRILALVVGPTTYAFSAMVAVFIAGIAIGSLAGGWLGRRGPAPGWLVVSLFVSGGAAATAAAWAPQIPLIVADAAAAPGSSFQAMVRLQFLLIGALMLPMTVAFGASFPLAIGLVARDDRRVAADVAVVYAANTLGAIGGALASGFVLIPRLGLQGSVRVAALLVFAGAALVGVRYATRRTRRWTVGSAAVAATLALWLAPTWDRALLSSGAYKYAAYLPPDNREALLGAGTLLYYREGAVSTVSVRRLAGSTSLAIDGKVDASNAGDMLTQRLLAHVPLLLHPDPRRVAIIGLGSGVTLGSALRHPVQGVDSVEISPEVVEASAHFSRENGRAIEDPRSRLIVGDGRSHVMLGSTAYDVVISEPSNPWMAGVAGLFTREMFDGIRRRLGPGGLVCQWAHAYDMSAADLRSIVATFTDVFPHASLWMIGESDVLLLGSTDPIEPRLSLLRDAWQRPGVARDLDDVGVTSPEVLLSLFTAGEPALRVFASGAGIQRDDRLALEFTGPRSLYGRAAEDNVDVLRALAAQPGVPEIVREARRSVVQRRNRGLMLLRAEAFAAATDDLTAAVEHDPNDAVAVDALARAAASADRLDEVERLLRTLVGRDGRSLATSIGLSRLLASRGQFPEAVDVVRRALADRRDVPALEQIASVFADAGDQEQLRGAVARLQQAAPEADATVHFAAVLALMAGRPDEAVRVAGRLERAPARARDLTLLGAAHAAAGRRDEARRLFEAALSADPRDVTSHENLGAFELTEGRPQSAAGHYAEALVLDPSSPIARQGLADALRRLR